MSLRDFLACLTEALEGAGIEYMITGSVASTYYSAPRTTQDVDIVVETDGLRLTSFLALLPEDRFYFDMDAARDALRRRSLFNVIDMETGWKADLIIRKGRNFNAEELSRRVRVQLFGLSIWMATPEDCILSKLEWARASNSERQLRDVRGIIEAQRAVLDQAYIQRWVHELRLEAQWAAICGTEG